MEQLERSLCMFGLVAAGTLCAIQSHVTAQAPTAGTRYVNQAHPLSASSNGLSWATAYRSLQVGINDTSATELWVASGTYTPDTKVFVEQRSGDEKYRTFVLREITDWMNPPPDLEIYGGFIGYEGDRSLRDWITNKTVLDGDIAGTPGDISDDVYSVLYAKNVARTVLDGFVIQNGHSSSSLAGSPTEKKLFKARGGGLFMFHDCSMCNFDLTIRNCTMRNNTAQDGGAAYLEDAFPSASVSPSFIDTRFIDNTALAAFGGGVFVNGGQTTYSGCEFNGNIAKSSGGGVCLGDPVQGGISFMSGSFTDCRFVDNQAEEQFGGGLFFEVDTEFTTPQSISLIGCDFHGNTAGTSSLSGGLGGGAAFLGSQVPFIATPITNVTISDCTFVGNSTTILTAAGLSGGGALSMRGPMSTVMSKSRFFGNQVFGDPLVTTDDGSGGAIIYRTRDNTEGDFCIQNSVFGCNSAEGDSVSAGGGAIFYDSANDSSLTMINCTVTGNTSQGTAGGIRVFPGGSKVRISNSILWYNFSSSGDTCDQQLFTGSWTPTGPGILFTDYQNYEVSCSEVTSPLRLNNQGLIPPNYIDLVIVPCPPTLPVINLRHAFPSVSTDTGNSSLSLDPLFVVEGFICGEEICLSLDADCAPRCDGIEVDRGAYESPAAFIDCNINGHPDLEDIATGFSSDCDGDGVPDECAGVDCNMNGTPDVCEIVDGTATDCDLNGILDECEPIIDCNSNLIHDPCDVASGTSNDCNGNMIPDECEDCDGNGFADECDNNCTGDIAPVSLTDPCVYGDGVINILDRLMVEGNYGSCPSPDDYICTCQCEGDVNDNGVVDFFDLLLVLNPVLCPGHIWDDAFCDPVSRFQPIVNTSGVVTNNVDPPPLNIEDKLGTVSQVNEQTSADDFLSIVTGSIQEICFWGFDTIDSNLTCPLGSHKSFRISFYDTALHPRSLMPVPRKLLASFDVDEQTGSLDIASAGYELTDDFNMSREMLVYRATLSGGGFPVVAWESYWIEIQSLNTVQETCKWVWAWSKAGNWAAQNNPSSGSKYTDLAQPQVNRNLAWGADINFQNPVIQLPDPGQPCTIANIQHLPQVSLDCNETGIRDYCDIRDGISLDCNLNGIPDECENLPISDCNGNWIDDVCDVLTGGCPDVNMNLIPDSCEGGNPCP